MASFQAVNSAVDALRVMLDFRIGPELVNAVANPTIIQLGPSELRTGPAAHSVGIYLHRISADPDGRNRYLQPKNVGEAPQPEFPINLHLLLIAWTDTTINEAPLLGWAMQQVGNGFEFDPTHLGGGDAAWGESDTLRITPEDMSTENLLRIWDGMPGDYRLSAPYTLRTIRLEPAERITKGPPVTTIAMPTGTI